MQFPAVREAVIDAITSTLVGSKARASDALAIHRHRTEPESVSSRTWMVKLSGPPVKTEGDVCVLFEATFDLVGFYPSGTDTDDRVGSDAERLYLPLWQLHTANADLVSSEPGDASVDDGAANMTVVRMPLRVTYRLDSTLT